MFGRVAARPSWNVLLVAATAALLVASTPAAPAGAQEGGFSTNPVSVPDPNVEAERSFRPVKGEVPSPINPPPGCVFHPRCPIAVERCKQIRPEFRELRPGHWVACSEVQ